jgi:hypothetical protein
MRGAYKVLVGRPEGRNHLENLWDAWKDNIEMGLKEGG